MVCCQCWLERARRTSRRAAAQRPPEAVRSRACTGCPGCRPRARWNARRRRLVRFAALAIVAPLLSGCGLLGGLNGSRSVAPQSMTVTSPEFRTDELLPRQYTCAGVSPPLYWSGAFAQQPKSFALVVDDGEAPINPYVYWIVFDISPSTTAIAQNRLPTGARQAQNSGGKARYDPPCPKGSAAHSYRFTVYALDAFLKLPNGAGLLATWSAIAKHVIAVGRLTVRAG
jgi:Raf kinase inhibitor-like YbhB/YbcL family protein